MGRFGRKPKEEQLDTSVVPELETKTDEVEQKQEPKEPKVKTVETKVESLEDFLF